VTRYDAESWAAGEIPVFSYYMLLQSKPAGGDEKTVDLAHLRDPALMRAYWADVRLFFERARGSKTVVLHVEPDLWGYVEQAGAVSLARSFAQQFVRLRDQLAPNVLLAYHRSGWGTKHDIVYEKPPNAVVERYAAQSAAVYRSLHAKSASRSRTSPTATPASTRCSKGNAKTRSRGRPGVDAAIEVDRRVSAGAPQPAVRGPRTKRIARQQPRVPALAPAIEVRRCISALDEEDVDVEPVANADHVPQ